MASIPQISASLVSATNQNSVGLANFNLEFALFKIAAPAEYSGLGIALSKQRRENAEEGPLHRTARKLGMLFEQIVPPIPDLIKAYGTRVSDIAAVFNIDLTDTTAYGPFARHVGVDGTSIYAAATSGPSAIAIHLLACMLARSWPATVATSIWVELIAGRRKELEKNFDPSQIQSLLAHTAAQQEISRADLAAWDASARAWLRTADQVKSFQQTQLKLIIKNSGLSLNTAGSTYDSVVEAWLMAMKSLQKLILGIPHNISKASVLLGLLSWHIYPDLNVVDPEKNIQFHDPLVDGGGVVTLGLERVDSLGDGVHWSLSLSHLRFYGNPVAVARSIGSVGSDDGRLTMPELHLVALGCVMASWKDPAKVDLISAANCFVALGQCLEPLGQSPIVRDIQNLEDSLAWVRLLVNAAKSLLSGHGMHRSQALDLVELGRRRARNFLGDPPESFCPMFGLVNPLVLCSLLQDPVSNKNLAGSIDTLRQVSSRCKFLENDCVIRYRPKCSDIVSSQIDGLSVEYETNFEYTTAVPHMRKSHKRDRNGELLEIPGHSSWVHVDATVDPAMQRYLDYLDFNEHFVEEVDQKLPWPKQQTFDTFEDVPELNSLHATTDYCNCQGFCHLSTCSCRQNSRKCTTLCNCTALDQEHVNECGNRRPRREQLEKACGSCRWLTDSDIRTGGKSFTWNRPPRQFWWRNKEIHPPVQESKYIIADPDFGISHEIEMALALPGEDPLYDPAWKSNNIDYRLIAGNAKTAALFTLHTDSTPVAELDIDELTKTLRSSKISSTKLSSYLTSIPKEGIHDGTIDKNRTPAHDLFSSLMALVSASELYEHWPEATISLEVTKRPLGQSHWASHLRVQPDGAARKLQDNPCLHRARKFACIGMLESGTQDLHPDLLNNVMAMASGNSIYVAEALLQDPSDRDRSGDSQFVGLRRILGSLDRPGIVMLVPPQAPRVRDPDLKSWRVVQQTQYDGLTKNSFQKTSLHLTFTEYEVPLAVAPGNVDPEVIMLEALISVHDGRDWVADLDILGSLAKSSLTHSRQCTCYKPDNVDAIGSQLAAKLGSRLKAMNNWEEFLCCKENLMSTEIGVLRTSKNWIARLAAASISDPKGYSARLLPSGSTCLACADRLIEAKAWSRAPGEDFDLLIA